MLLTGCHDSYIKRVSHTCSASEVECVLLVDALYMFDFSSYLLVESYMFSGLIPQGKSETVDL